MIENNSFERLQVEGVNGNRCQGNIKIDAKTHTEIYGKTMPDLCSTNDANIVGKGSQIEVERDPTNE